MPTWGSAMCMGFVCCCAAWPWHLTDAAATGSRSREQMFLGGTHVAEAWCWLGVGCQEAVVAGFGGGVLPCSLSNKLVHAWALCAHK